MKGGRRIGGTATLGASLPDSTQYHTWQEADVTTARFWLNPSDSYWVQNLQSMHQSQSLIISDRSLKRKSKIIF